MTARGRRRAFETFEPVRTTPFVAARMTGGFVGAEVGVGAGDPNVGPAWVGVGEAVGAGAPAVPLGRAWETTTIATTARTSAAPRMSAAKTGVIRRGEGNALIRNTRRGQTGPRDGVAAP
jgi:hypothetical protein